MIALVTGFLLVAYLLAPGAIYRLAFSFSIPSKRFQRTRTEEIVFSVLVTTLPFLLTWILLLYTPLGGLPPVVSSLSKTAAYRNVLASMLATVIQDPATLLASYLRAFREQGRFIAWLWLLCFAEGLLSGRIVRRYGDYAEGSIPQIFCEKFLLNHVSEWQVLFTTMTLPSADKNQIVEVDALSLTNILYRGRLVNWFADQDGKLAGIFLANAQRYQRDELTRDRDAGVERAKEEYWAPIPGSNLYLTAASITNYNVRYLEPTRSQIVEEELGPGIIITPLPPSS